jgi:hypothetical protein
VEGVLNHLCIGGTHERKHCHTPRNRNPHHKARIKNWITIMMDGRHGLEKMQLKLGKSHPAYMVFNGLYHKKLASELGFVKVSDIPKFLMGIAMHNGDEAYSLIFQDGRLTEVTPAAQEHGEVDIERGRFTRLLFGRISPEVMDEEFSMYYFQNSDLRNLFEILFPEMQSHVVSVN